MGAIREREAFFRELQQDLEAQLREYVFRDSFQDSESTPVDKELGKKNSILNIHSNHQVTDYHFFNKVATPLFDKFVFIMSMSDEMTLEERNLINMILFHKAKLKRIQKGASAVQLFSAEERRKLRRHGILTYRNMTWSISEKAGEIIENRGVQG